MQLFGQRSSGPGRGRLGWSGLVETNPGTTRLDAAPRQLLWNSESWRPKSEIVMNWRKRDAELGCELPQLRKASLSPAPCRRLALRPPFGILGKVRAGGHGWTLPIGAAAASTGARRIRGTC